MNDPRPHGTRLGDRRVAEPRREAERALHYADLQLKAAALALVDGYRNSNIRPDSTLGRLISAAQMYRAADEEAAR